MRVDIRARARRRLLRPLVGAGLMIVGIVTPVEFLPLPEALTDRLGDATLQAQSTLPAFVQGTPDACPDDPTDLMPPWQVSPSGAECILETAGCPPSPVVDGQVLRPSADLAPQTDKDGNPILRSPGFCEERYLEEFQPTEFAACAGVRGFVRRMHDMNEVPDAHGNLVTVRMCRLIHTPTCAAGLSRIEPNRCRAVMRRTWTCPAGYVPRNVYLSCFNTGSSGSTGTHPACGPGSPDFVALDCEDYVGIDYVEDPTLLACSTFDTGHHSMAQNSRSGSAGDWWCEFDASLMKVVCHTVAAPASECAATVGLCLKRASRTGGCDTIIATIYCRYLQGRYEDGLETAEDVRAEGCEPCIVLPFRPVPSNCPRDLTREPPRIFPPRFSRIYAKDYNNIFAAGGIFLQSDRRNNCHIMYDNGESLQNYPACARPICRGFPAGSINWKSSHHSGLALVNAAVSFAIDEIPTTHMTELYAEFIPPSGSLPGAEPVIRSKTFLAYENDPFDPDDDELVRARLEMDPGRAYGSVDEYLSSESSGLGNCVIEIDFRPTLAEYRMIIEDLWPDNDAQAMEIIRLFGPRSLDAWNSLTTAEQERLTEARGLDFLGPSATPTEIANELEKRSLNLTEEVLCGHAGNAWCRWVPTRSGYFRIAGASASRASIYPYSTGWQHSLRISALNAFLANTVIRDALETQMNGYRLQAADLGLTPTLTAALPRPPGAVSSLAQIRDEWLSSEEAGEQFRCPTVDFRVDCGILIERQALIYQETEAVGIRVHDVRVATRTPNL